MRYLPVFCFLFCSFPALAADQHLTPVTPQPAPTTIQVIDGKKFFSLQNARRFTGSVNSPHAQSVMHYPRMEGTIASRRTPLPVFPAGTSATPVTQDAADKILSIFAPNEKAGAPLPTK